MVPSPGATYNYSPSPKKKKNPTPSAGESILSTTMSLQVPRVLLPDGPGVQLRVTDASQAGAVRDEGSHPHVEGAGRGQPGAQEV